MIFVTHDQVEAMTLAHRIVVMNNRRIEQIGTPMEIYARPATQFVATFVGTPAMNFVPVELPSVAQAVRERCDCPTARRSHPHRRRGLPQGQSFSLGVRAESRRSVCAATRAHAAAR